jgi:alpha-tubulin suppressor-like RCC1 family protein
LFDPFRFVHLRPVPIRFVRALICSVVLGGGLILSMSCGDAPPAGPPLLHVASIAIDTPTFAFERGALKILTATVKDSQGNKLDIPVVWRSSNGAKVRVMPDGRFVALDTGQSIITASTVGATSPPIGAVVTWVGPASIEVIQFTAPNAAMPLAPVTDSIRVAVKNRVGGPVSGARVRFDVTVGGGTVAAASDTTDASGRVAAKWTLGSSVGTNTVTATVVSPGDTLVPWISGNPVSFSINSYNALQVVAGNGQTAQVLDSVTTKPVVKLVDASGAPRPGIPITFIALGGGRVRSVTVPTGADGTASPGTWTLGDVTGDQTLLATVESARVTFHATATGTALYYKPASITAGGFVSCALAGDGVASCWGTGALSGSGDTTSTAKPTPIDSPTVKFTSLGAGSTHFCGVATGATIYCWGANSLTDTSGLTVSSLRPKQLGSAIAWSKVTAGDAHNCALATDQTPYCWGNNNRGQLGDLTTTVRFKPVPVSGGFKFSSVSAGSAFTCGLTLAGTALCWGANNNGQLGDGTRNDRSAPTVLSGGFTYQSIGVGESWGCGLTTTSKVACWGAMVATGQVETTPKTFDDAPVFTSLSVGGGHACALTGDGTAYCWGANNGGQVGDSTVASRAKPTKVNTTLKFSVISAGYSHTCGLTTDGRAVCWGLNRAGEVGDDNAAFALIPRYIVIGAQPSPPPR